MVGSCLCGQVLHLMNLMNLPPPFGPITATPPGLEGGEREEEEEGGSEPESEVGSDEGTRSKRLGEVVMAVLQCPAPGQRW